MLTRNNLFHLSNVKLYKNLSSVKKVDISNVLTELLRDIFVQGKSFVIGMKSN